jgi:phytoene dehydrogenase-like protein
MQSSYDAVVIGAGVGGCCIAALLAHQGKRVLLAEKRSSLGGRFSTVNRDGYLCATGGLAVPVGRNLEQVCRTVGIPSGVRPSTKVATWLDGKIYDHSDGVTRRIIREVATCPEEARRVLAALNRAMQSHPPDNEISFRDWLSQSTANPRIHGLFQATISSLLTVNSHELPAGEYFNVIKVISPLTFGFIEGGSLSLWQRMAALIRDAGGTVVTGAAARGITVHGQVVQGVHLRYQRRDHQVAAPLVISNLGPSATAELVEPAYIDESYRAQLDRINPTAILWLHFASDELLMDYSAMSVGCSRRVNMIDVPSLEAGGVAPPGQHLYTVGAAPLDSIHPGDIKEEFEAVMEDLRDIFDDFDRKCRVLTRTCYRGKWPGFRTVPGSRPSPLTPVENLYNVGDGVSPPGYEGSMGAAKSAQEVLEHIVGRETLGET